MADRLCDEIIAGTYKADDRIPSVREYAVYAAGEYEHCSEGLWATLSWGDLYTIGVDLATLFQLVHVNKL